MAMYLVHHKVIQTTLVIKWGTHMVHWLLLAQLMALR